MIVQWGWKTVASGGVADNARPWRDGSRMARRSVARLRRRGWVAGTAQDGEEFLDGVRVWLRPRAASRRASMAWTFGRTDWRPCSVRSGSIGPWPP